MNASEIKIGQLVKYRDPVINDMNFGLIIKPPKPGLDWAHVLWCNGEYNQVSRFSLTLISDVS